MIGKTFSKVRVACSMRLSAMPVWRADLPATSQDQKRANMAQRGFWQHPEWEQVISYNTESIMLAQTSPSVLQLLYQTWTTKTWICYRTSLSLKNTNAPTKQKARRRSVPRPCRGLTSSLLPLGSVPTTITELSLLKGKHKTTMLDVYAENVFVQLKF